MNAADESSTTTDVTAPEAKSDDSLDKRVPGYRYGVLLFLLMATFFYLGATSPWPLDPLITVLLESLTLLVALLASGAARLVIYIALVVVTAGIAIGVAEVITHDQTILAATAAVSALLVLVAPISIVHGVLGRRVLDTKTVLAALCLYVLIGLFFSYTFEAVQVATGHSFFAQLTDVKPGQPSDFLYFSFATLTTVGYGDLTAGSPLGRTLADLEAMFGQIYLVTVVALLVSNLGPAFIAKRAAAAAAAKSQD